MRADFTENLTVFLVNQFMWVCPKISPPKKDLSLVKKFIYSCLSLLVLLWYVSFRVVYLSNNLRSFPLIPMYGQSSDSWRKNREFSPYLGTLCEVGYGPIFITNLLVQSSSFLHFFPINPRKGKIQELYFKKLKTSISSFFFFLFFLLVLTILYVLIEALISVFVGVNTPSEKLGNIGSILIFLQIFLSGYIIVTLVCVFCLLWTFFFY
jgi:hypothetical protein